jgi:transporter family-2 protein
MGNLTISVIAFFVAMTNALQSRVNGAASATIDNPVIAAMMSVGGGFLAATILVLASARLRKSLSDFLTRRVKLNLEPWQFFAGMGGGVFIFGQALVVPEFGVAIYIIAVVAGQTVASLFVDKYGIGPAGRKPITFLRVISALLATVGVVVSSLGKAEISQLVIPALLFGILAGSATALQYALNGRISREVNSTMITSSLNFFMGFCFLSLLLLISSAANVWRLVPPPSVIEQPLLWTGGLLGLSFIASAAFFVGRLGVLRFAVVSVLGQLVGALLLDVFAPAPGTILTIWVPIGLSITLAGVLLGFSQNKPKIGARP